MPYKYETRKQQTKQRDRKRVLTGYWRRWRAETKERIFTKYGDECCKCGFSDRRALQIDHVNGGGRIDMRENTPHMTYLRRVLNDTTGKYQILCANCNWIKRHERREHDLYLEERNKNNALTE